MPCAPTPDITDIKITREFEEGGGIGARGFDFIGERMTLCLEDETSASCLENFDVELMRCDTRRKVRDRDLTFMSTYPWGGVAN